MTSAGMDVSTLDALADSLARAEGDFITTPAGAGTRTAVLRFARHYAAYFAEIEEDFSQDEIFSKDYLLAAQACLRSAKALLAAAEEGSYEATRNALKGYTPHPLGKGVKKDDQTPASLYFKDQREKFKKKIDDLISSIQSH